MPTRTESVTIAAPDGAMLATLALPAGSGRFPAVVVIMEAFGLVPHIGEVAQRLAGEGYVAIAPDFYYRLGPDNKASYDDLPRAISLMGKLDHAKFVEDMRATLDFLAKRSEVDATRIGVTGFCMGGLLSFLTATALPDRIRASAPFYGGGIPQLLPRAGSIRCPLYLFFGEQDAFIPLDQVKQIDAKLEELGKRYQIKVYPGAVHGFFCPQRPSYHEEAAKDAWEELKRFFAASLVAANLR